MHPFLQNPFSLRLSPNKGNKKKITKTKGKPWIHNPDIDGTYNAKIMQIQDWV